VRRRDRLGDSQERVRIALDAKGEPRFFFLIDHGELMDGAAVMLKPGFLTHRCAKAQDQVASGS
jgi:hypothetical protein